MNQRELREEIFKLLFENEINKGNISIRLEEVLDNLKISNKKKEFFSEYILNLKKNEESIKDMIKKHIKGWTFTRLATVEKVLLKMSFYEIMFKDIPFEIIINEVIELSKIYGDENSKSFINGILATFVREEVINKN